MVILGRYTQAGYPAEIAEADASLDRAARKEEEAREIARRTILAASLALPVFLLEMGSHLVPAVHDFVMATIGMQTSWLIQFALTTLVLFGPGLRFFRKGIPAILRGTPDMNSLVALGTSAAWGYSLVATFTPGVLPPGTANVYYEAAAVIVALILLGRYLEAKAKGRTSEAIKRLIGLQAKTINGVQEATAVQAWTGPVPALLSTFIMLTTLLGGGYLVMQGQFTLGELVAYQGLAMSFSGPITALASFGSELQQLRTYLGRLDDTLDQQVDPAFDETDVKEVDHLPKGLVRLVDASFGYNPLDPPLIDSLSLDIKPGQRVALVGPSGSGKSTVGKMIGGLVDLQCGQIEIDGRGRNQWPRHILASRLAFVRQEVMLFKGTVRENLSLWDESIADADLIQAAKDAAIHDRIMAWSGGYDAMIESGATNISGGEKQRLEIARALATNPSIIILDEATSALDPVSEFSVMEAIRRRGLTCIVIAHRLSTIRDCDEIIVLERGQILERGPHSALLQKDGPYARLLEA